MTIEVNRELRGLDGEVLKEQFEKKNEDGKAEIVEGEILTVKKVCTIALLSTARGEELKGDEKYANFEFAKRVNEASKTSGVLEITTDEAVKLKERVNKFYGSLIVGIFYDIIEGKE